MRYNIPRAPRQSQTLSEDCGKLGRRSSQNLPLRKAIDFSCSRFTADFATVHLKHILLYDLWFSSPPSGTTEPCQNIGLLKYRIFLKMYGAEPGFSPDMAPSFLLRKQRKHMGDYWSASIFKYISLSIALLHYWGISQTRNWMLLKATDLLFVTSFSAHT